MALQTFLLFAVYVALIFTPGVIIALRIRKLAAAASATEPESGRWAPELTKSL